MAYTTINKSTAHFNPVAYTGGSGDTAQTVGFQPDLVWIKERTRTRNHAWFDAIRGSRRWIGSNSSGAEDYNTGAYLASFNSNGFTTTNTDVVGKNGQTYASWNWKANGQGSSNTDGSINTTYTSANTTAGFSIVKYTGNGTANATIGHGLGVEPAMILFKRLDSSNNWIVYQKTMGTGHYLTLNTNGASDSASGAWCTPSSTLIQLNQVFGATNTNSATYIAYCFAEKTGYSKFGSYVGNGSASLGTFIYTGFKPAFVMRKSYSSGHNGNWLMHDTKINPHNEAELQLSANADTAEETSTNYNEIDILSNGFKMRGSGTWSNGSGRSYIYMAFAEAPLVGTNNVPCTAR